MAIRIAFTISTLGNSLLPIRSAIASVIRIAGNSSGVPARAIASSGWRSASTRQVRPCRLPRQRRAPRLARRDRLIEHLVEADHRVRPGGRPAGRLRFPGFRIPRSLRVGMQSPKRTPVLQIARLQLTLAGRNTADGVRNLVFGSSLVTWKRSNRLFLFPPPLPP